MSFSHLQNRPGASAGEMIPASMINLLPDAGSNQARQTQTKMSLITLEPSHQQASAAVAAAAAAGSGPLGRGDPGHQNSTAFRLQPAEKPLTMEPAVMEEVKILNKAPAGTSEIMPAG